MDGLETSWREIGGGEKAGKGHEASDSCKGDERAAESERARHRIGMEMALELLV